MSNTACWKNISLIWPTRSAQSGGSLVYIDGFAGPWETKDPDYADSSFGVAIDSLRRCQIGLLEKRGRQLQIESILVEERKGAFAQLQKFATDKSLAGFGVHPLPGKFVDQIPEINETIGRSTQNPFRFIFLDPKGWADIPMQKLRPFLRDRSCEVLILALDAEAVRYFLIYATKHSRGVEVFKDAEIKAARIQDAVRHETQIAKTHQPNLMFGEERPSSLLTLKLRQRYMNKARKKLLHLLRRRTGATGFAYADLFCEVMAFPLVTPDDLISWLNALEGKVRIVFAGSSRRRKPSPMENDRVVVIDSKALHDQEPDSLL